MILDDLFSQAAQNHESGKGTSVQCSFTTNSTGGLLSKKTNKDSASEPVNMTYTPEQRVVSGKLHESTPAYFSGSSFSGELTITSPKAFSPIGNNNYNVELLGAAFVPAVDDTTHIIYGAAGAVFVTISLCGMIPTDINK